MQFICSKSIMDTLLMQCFTFVLTSIFSIVFAHMIGITSEYLALSCDIFFVPNKPNK